MVQQKVITRFAPSPSGFLHIGGARTALLNWLYAKHYNGEFLLRIEDTDKQRSNPDAINEIIDGLKWLGIHHDSEVIFQSSNVSRHIEIVNKLIGEDKAYYCYDSCNPGKTDLGFRSKWRDRNKYSIPQGAKPVVRLKAPDTGNTIIHDKVYGEISINNSTIEDLVLLRSDGTPTYMTSVVVDDYDMGITHVIRGNDHITNTAKQILIYNALGWPLPIFAHIPLIHGSDGSKLSKRHGALAVTEYYKMGFIPEAMRNYLLRLGWSHGDDEIISDEEAINWFDLDGIGKSPANFDIKKLEHINHHYLQNIKDILQRLKPFMEINDAKKKLALEKGVPIIIGKAKTLVELAELSKIFIIDQVVMNDEAKKALSVPILAKLTIDLRNLELWDKGSIISVINELSVQYSKQAIYHNLRAMITGTMNSPAIIPVMLALGKDVTLARLNSSDTIK